MHKLLLENAAGLELSGQFIYGTLCGW